MSDEIRINAGFVIFGSVKVGNVEFVVGKNIHTENSYVTWESKDGTNMYWGHYMTNRDAAIKDMNERAKRERILQQRSQAGREER